MYERSTYEIFLRYFTASGIFDTPLAGNLSSVISSKVGSFSDVISEKRFPFSMNFEFINEINHASDSHDEINVS